MGLPWLVVSEGECYEVEGIVASASGGGGWKEVGPVCRQRPAGPFPELTGLPPGVKTRGGYLEPGWEDGTPPPACGHGALACVPLHCWPG